VRVFFPAQFTSSPKQRLLENLSNMSAACQCFTTPTTVPNLNVGRRGNHVRLTPGHRRVSLRAVQEGEIRKGSIKEIPEIHAELPFAPELWTTFFEKYWQKEPVVIRGGLPTELCTPVDNDELAGLACETEFRPRIIRKGDEGPSSWSLQMGPFSEDELESLPSDGSWCLLLNDLEKHVSEFMDVLNLFDRFPRWRVADVQASISSDGGSVGAHSDQFDVFLIQGTGHKRWSISDCAEYVPDNDEAFFPEAEVRILKNFQPQSCSLLKQGDILYLPPKIAHHGVAEGCKTICTTFSVGFLAPAHDELVLSYAQASVDTYDGSQRWRDPWLKPQEHVGEISSEAVAQAAEIIRQSMPKNDADIARWFGCHATQSFGMDPSETIPAKDLSADELVVQFAEEGSLQRRADAKFAFVQEVKDGSLEGGLFFAAGNMWLLQSAAGWELARHIANYDEIIADDWIESGDAAEYDIDSEAKTLLHDLFSSGLIYFS